MLYVAAFFGGCIVSRPDNPWGWMFCSWAVVTEIVVRVLS
jgi:hypothetical protein